MLEKIFNLNEPGNCKQWNLLLVDRVQILARRGDVRYWYFRSHVTFPIIYIMSFFPSILLSIGLPITLSILPPHVST
jgi:hypothetical protein